MPTSAAMTFEQGRVGIAKLEACVRNVLAADPKAIKAFSPEARSLAANIRRTLAEVFGRDAPEYARAAVTASSFKPSSGHRTMRAERAAAFAAGRVFAVRNLEAEIDRLKEHLPTRRGLPGAEVRAEAGNFGSVGMTAVAPPEPTHEVSASYGLVGDHSGSVVSPSVGTAGASQPDPSATFAGEGAFSADATVVRPSEPDAYTLAASAEQRPAAYRFELRDGKIDALPEAPEPEDQEFALDTYRELLAKVRELHERLKATNSPPRVVNNVEQLLTALGTRFDDLRPGVLLSRSRSLEADRAAFGVELLADTIAMMDDTARTLRDLLASFPLVRRIEAEVLALDLDRNADAVPIIQKQMDAIAASAALSGAVTEEALGALARNDAAIEDATDPVVRRSLVGDKLLVFRNFSGAVISGIAGYGRIAGAELGELAGKSWKEIKNQLPKSIGATTALVPPFALVGLAVWLSDPVTAVAVAVASFKPMAQILKGFARDQKPSTAKKHPNRGKIR